MKNSLFISLFIVALSSCMNKEEVLHEQYRVEGLALYQKKCENCHQENGKGFKKLYPALVGTDLLKRYSDLELAKLIVKGVEAKDGHEFMPTNKDLAPIEIAEIITYIKDLNGVKKGIVEQDSVKL